MREYVLFFLLGQWDNRVEKCKDLKIKVKIVVNINSKYFESYR